MAMTIEEQRIALAEWEGLKCRRCNGTGEYFRYGLHEWFRRNMAKSEKQEPVICDRFTEDETRPFERLFPNYPSNLNAVHELEKRLSEHQQSEYIKFMIWNRIGPDNTNLVIWEAFISTASQRCEALCRVLWPERWL